MDRVAGLISRAALAFVATFLVVSAAYAIPPTATVQPDEATAISVCNQWIAYDQSQDLAHAYNNYSCTYYGGQADAGGIGGNCPSGLYTNNSYGENKSVASTGQTAYQVRTFKWCVAAKCNAGDPATSGTNTMFNRTLSDSAYYQVNGCCATFHPTSIGTAQVCYPNGACAAFGQYLLTGSRCSSAMGDPGPKPKPCGGASCYDPDHGFCAVTDSGEQICVPAPKNPGEPTKPQCSVGATGAVCSGNPPPAPPTPPIPPGQPPDKTDNPKLTDSSGNSSNPIITVSSGTDPGSNPSGSGNGSNPSSGGTTGGPSSGGTTGGAPSGNTGGSGSNNNGNGNSGKNGTDPNGKCPAGNMPTASGCSGTFSDANCDSPPACYGDAVLCGIAREDAATRCAAQKIADQLGKNGSAALPPGVPQDGGASGDPSVSQVVSDEGGSTKVDDSGLGWSRSCPASPSFDLMGSHYVIETGPLCTLAEKLGWLIMLLAALWSARIVSGS